MVEIKGEILPVLEQIEQTHKLPKEEIIKSIETAITNAGIKFFGSGYKIVTDIDVENVEIKTYMIKKVVDIVKDEKQEISLEEAKKIKEDSKTGDEIRILLDNEVFLRIAAQTAKKALTQKIRESFKRNVYEEYQSKIGEIIVGTVYAIRGKTMILDLGKVEGILPQREQVFKENLRVGQVVKVLVKDVERTKKGVNVIVSRFDKNFIKKLFEYEIPEIKDGIIEIVKIVRAAGHRTKIVLKSNNPKVDPVGSCVGVRGARIRPIINELRGEKVDLIPYTENILKFIEYSLSPWKPQKIEIIDEQNKQVKVYLPINIFNTISEKNNLNLNLAKELTGWDIRLEIPKESAEKISDKNETKTQQ